MSMKDFGSLSEVLSLVFRDATTGFQVTIQPNASASYSADRVISLPNQNAASTLVSLNSTDSLTNKTIGSGNILSGATAVNLVSGSGTLTLNTTGTMTLPNATDTVVGKATTDALTNKTIGSGNILTGATAINLVSGSGNLTLNTTGTVTLPNATDTLVGKATTDILTNKTLSGNTAVTLISGAGTLTLNTSGNATVPNTTDTLVGKATTDVLTNKTLSGNTAVTLISGSGTLTLNTSGTVTLPNATDTLVGKATTDILTNKTLNGNTATTLVSGAGTLTLNTSGTATVPNVTDTLVALAATQALTNKDYQGGTASNTSRITVPGAATATLSGLTRKQATIVYDTTLNQLFSDDGSNLNPVGSGAGEKNYVTTGTSNAGGWVASGAGITVATDTTAVDLPRALTSKSGILLSRVSGSIAYGYYRFTLDAADYSRKLKIKLDQKPGGSYVASDFKVDIYSNTASDYSGTSTRLTLSTDSSAITALANLTGQFQCAFDASGSTAPYMELRVGLNAGTSGTTLAISDVIVGPGIQPQGAVVGPWLAYTPTGTWATNTTYTAYYRRIGEEMEIDAVANLTGAPTGTFTLNLPTGFTINTGVLGAINAGIAVVFGAGAAKQGGNSYQLVVKYGTTTAVRMQYQSNASGVQSDVNATQPVTFANGDYVQLHFQLPINEWAGSGTINVVQNDVEYVFNTSGTTAANGSDTTSFGYGPKGALVGAITSSSTTAQNTSMRVRFATPIQSTDIVSLEFTDDTANSSNDWFPLGNYAQVVPFIEQGTARYGAGMIPVSGSSTDIDVVFGNGGGRTTNTTYGNAGEAWNTRNTSWRVKKSRGGQAVGFGNVAQSSSGLVKSAGQLLGTNTNDVAASTYVGEVLSQSRLRSAATSISTNTPLNITSTALTLTAGDWDIYGTVGFDPAASTSITQVVACISQTSATLSATDTTAVYNSSGEIRNVISVAATVPGSADDLTVSVSSNVQISASTIFYLVAQSTFTVSTLTGFGQIWARRRR